MSPVPGSTEKTPIIERAIELAKSGGLCDLTALRKKLREERYGIEANYIFGKGLKRQLMKLLSESRPTQQI